MLRGEPGAELEQGLAVALTELVEDLPPGRIGKSLEDVSHRRRIGKYLLACQPPPAVPAQEATIEETVDGGLVSAAGCAAVVSSSILRTWCGGGTRWVAKTQTSRAATHMGSRIVVRSDRSSTSPRAHRTRPHWGRGIATDALKAFLAVDRSRPLQGPDRSGDFVDDDDPVSTVSRPRRVRQRCVAPRKPRSRNSCCGSTSSHRIEMRLWSRGRRCRSHALTRWREEPRWLADGGVGHVPVDAFRRSLLLAETRRR